MHGVDRRPLRQRTPQPGLRGRGPDLARAPPDPPRRHLEQRQPVAAGVGEGGGVEVGERDLQGGAQLAARERPRGEQRTGEGDDRPEVGGAQRRAVLAVARQLAVEHRLHQRSQEEAVVGRDEVDGGPHHHDADDLAVEEQLAQLVGLEPVEAGPQGHVRVLRHLGLEADQVVDRVEDGPVRAPEQELALERRPVEGARAEDVGGHRHDRALRNRSTRADSAPEPAGSVEHDGGCAGSAGSPTNEGRRRDGGQRWDWRRSDDVSSVPADRLRTAMIRTAELTAARSPTGRSHDDADDVRGTIESDDAVGFDPRPLLAALDRAGARAVVIGQVAGILHGSTELTGDLDLLWSGRPEEAVAMARAFADVGAELADDDGQPLPVDASAFAHAKVVFRTSQASGDCCTPALAWGALDVAALRRQGRDRDRRRRHDPLPLARRSRGHASRRRSPQGPPARRRARCPRDHTRDGRIP